MQQPIAFTAASAEEAVAQIRARLGPEAIVLNVRPLPVNGLARLWQKPMIEVLAYLPEAAAPSPQPEPISDVLAEFRQQLHEIKQQVQSRAALAESVADKGAEPAFFGARAVPARSSQSTSGGFEDSSRIGDREAVASRDGSRSEDLGQTPPLARFPRISSKSNRNNAEWRVGEMLQKGGLLPVLAEQIVEELQAEHGENPPASLSEEVSLAQTALEAAWRTPPPLTRNSLHVLIGPAGSGKTTCLCKWLTQAALVEGRRARVWRLDGATANMAESLTVYCEILGVPSERTWRNSEAIMEGAGQPLAPTLSHNGDNGAGDPQPFTEDLGFIDLPGVDARNPLAIKELAGLLKQLGSPRVHLVLNGAYETPALLAQARAFSGLPVEDLIITHLDEESRWGKIWNLVLGTNYPVRHLSTGQNIPGDFCEATAEILLSRQFPNKQRVSRMSDHPAQSWQRTC